MANKVLGTCACPVCSATLQEIRETEKRKPYIICIECGCQIFARQPKSVKILLDLAEPDKMSASSASEPAPAAAAPAAEPDHQQSDDEGGGLLDKLWNWKGAEA